jgi:hypothetical protein
VTDNRELTRQDLDAYVIERASRDEAYRQRLHREPLAVLSEAISALAGEEVRLPADLEVRVVEETATTVYLVLPAPSVPADELVDEQLEAIAGGGSWGPVRSVTFGTIMRQTQTANG